MEMFIYEVNTVRIMYASVRLQPVRGADPVFRDQDWKMVSLIYFSQSIPESYRIYNLAVFSLPDILILCRAVDTLFAQHDLLISGACSDIG